MVTELSRYAGDDSVEAVARGEDVLRTVTRVEAASTSVAMVLADLRLRPDDGVIVLGQVRSLVPTTKRVLLLDWGLRPEQMPAVSRAATLGLVDTFLAKPTGARDEDFHVAITEDLADWAWTTTPVVSAVRIVGDAGEPRPGDIADRLQRLGIPTTIHVLRFGVAFDLARAAVALDPGRRTSCDCPTGQSPPPRAVVLACGVTYRRLEVPSLEALVGAGVFYGAATSHARELTSAHVVVVGAGNSGGQAAIHLARYAARVTIVARGNDLAATMSTYLIREIEGIDRITVCTATDVVDGGPSSGPQWVEVAHRPTGERSRVEAAALFVLIGTETRTHWLPAQVRRDEQGFVLTGADVAAATWPIARHPYALETSVPGLFAVGDVGSGSVKRVAAAVGEGAVSVPMIHRYPTEP